MHVLLAGGGTAGHIEPALALADALRRTDPDVTVTALGTERGLETRLVPERGYPLELIPAVPLPRRVGPGLFVVPTRLRGAVRAAAAVIDRIGADVVVGFGGYVALPAYLAARRRRVPIVVHEANARPGIANRIGARFTRHVATATPTTALPNAVHVGIPLRASIATLDRAAARDDARRTFGLASEQPTLLVFGGSQGAQHINTTVVEAAPTLLTAGVQVVHVTGPLNFDDVQAALPAAGPSYVALPYVDGMEQAYAAADLAVCRAGAMTCAELSAVGLPAVYVPLPHGNGEQRLNALPIVNAGGGVLIDDSSLTPTRLVDAVLAILNDSARTAAMGVAAARLGRRDADVTLAELVRRAAAR